MRREALGPSYVEPKTIGVVGSHRRDDWMAIEDALMPLLEPGVRICVDGTRNSDKGPYKGASTAAQSMAIMTGLECLVFPPDPKKTISEVAKHSDILIACPAPDRRGSTEPVIKQFLKLHPNGVLILV